MEKKLANIERLISRLSAISNEELTEKEVSLIKEYLGDYEKTIRQSALSMLEHMTLAEFNKQVKDAIDDYYKEHSADNFFRIDSLLKVCKKHDLTKESVPQLIEMQNIILMG